METLDIKPAGVQAAVDSLIGELVGASHWPDCSFINLPMTYPGGGNVTLQISPRRGGFRVSDAGFAFREAENFGVEQGFAKTAKHFADASELERDGQIIFVDATMDELYSAVCDVAAVSWQVATSLCSADSDAAEQERGDTLTARLISIFGNDAVQSKPKLIGASTNPWPVTALVHHRGKQAAFQVVNGSTYSVYRTSSAFSDISDLDDAPSLVAVVPSLQSLGTKLGLLTRSGRVIEQGESDAIYVKNAA